MFMIIMFVIAVFYVFAMASNEQEDELGLLEFLSVVIVDATVAAFAFVIAKINNYIDRTMAEYRKNVRV